MMEMKKKKEKKERYMKKKALKKEERIFTRFFPGTQRALAESLGRYQG
jgi:hypothetical protein